MFRSDARPLFFCHPEGSFTPEGSRGCLCLSSRTREARRDLGFVLGLLNCEILHFVQDDNPSRPGRPKQPVVPRSGFGDDRVPGGEESRGCPCLSSRTSAAIAEHPRRGGGTSTLFRSDARSLFFVILRAASRPKDLWVDFACHPEREKRGGISGLF